MNIITQFFRLDKSKIDESLRVINSSRASTIYIFSDTGIEVGNNIRVLTRRSRLKWNEVFDFVINNEFLNKEGCYIIEPGHIPPNITKDGLTIFNNGVFIKNLKKNFPVRRYIFSDYDFLRANTGTGHFRIASITHIYYEDIIDEIIKKLSNLTNTDFKVDYYFTLTKDSSTIGQKQWVKRKLTESFPNCKIIELPNKGLDIGPFFKVLENIYTNNKKYDYLVKTHTKKSLLTSGNYFGSMWRKDLLSIIEKTGIVSSHIENGELMIGSKKWIIPIVKDKLNIGTVNKLKKEMDIVKGDQFIGGTMFWVKFSMIKKYLPLDRVKKYYDEMEYGYFYQRGKADREYITHSFERIFGLMVGNEGKKIIGI